MLFEMLQPVSRQKCREQQRASAMYQKLVFNFQPNLQSTGENAARSLALCCCSFQSNLPHSTRIYIYVQRSRSPPAIKDPVERKQNNPQQKIYTKNLHRNFSVWRNFPFHFVLLSYFFRNVFIFI